MQGTMKMKDPPSQETLQQTKLQCWALKTDWITIMHLKKTVPNHQLPYRPGIVVVHHLLAQGPGLANQTRRWAQSLKRQINYTCLGPLLLHGIIWHYWMLLSLHFSSKKDWIFDKSSKTIDIVLVFFEPKWSPRCYHQKDTPPPTFRFASKSAARIRKCWEAASSDKTSRRNMEYWALISEWEQIFRKGIRISWDKSEY